MTIAFYVKNKGYVLRGIEKCSRLEVAGRLGVPVEDVVVVLDDLTGLPLGLVVQC